MTKNPDADHGEYRYDVGFLFAEPDREYVERAVRELKGMNIRCFYDADEEPRSEAWGKLRTEVNYDRYSNQFAWIVLIISQHYLDDTDLHWQWSAVETRAAREGRGHVLPVFLDDVPGPPSLQNVGRLNAAMMAPEKLAEEIRRKLDGRAASDGGRGVTATPVRPELDELVRWAYRDRISVAASRFGRSVPDRWDAASLKALHAEAVAVPPPRSVEDVRILHTLDVLLDAARAKPVMSALGVDGVRLAVLQQIYARTVHRLPRNGSSADMIILEAAQVSAVERRNRQTGELCALARLALGVAAHCRTSIDSPAVREWLGLLGHQYGDAVSHLEQKVVRKSWLIIDLGDEPRYQDEPLWPRTVKAYLITEEQRQPCEETCTDESDLERALRSLLDRLTVLTDDVVVDIVAPRALLDLSIDGTRIDALPVVRVDEGTNEFERLLDRHRPRMRWSHRRANRHMLRRLKGRSAELHWKHGVIPLPATCCDAEQRVVEWLKDHPHHPVLLAASPGPAGAIDPLRVLLKEGCGFVLWFPDGVDDAAQREITRAMSRLRPATRRSLGPDRLPRATTRPVIIWDDTEGREEFPLPPVLRLQEP